MVARYDWSDPAVVRWLVEESSYDGTGEGLVRISSREGGGSRLDVEWTNTNARRQRPLLLLLHRGPAGRVVSRLWASALDRYAEAQEN